MEKNLLNTLGFHKIASARKPDSSGRVLLPKLKSIDINHTDETMYDIYTNEDGQIILEPVVTIPKREAWLYQNPTALKSVKKGLKESAEGKTKYLGSFSKYADA